MEVAVKEIDKKLLNPKSSENLLKEISILSTINHPNIIRLFEAIQTEEKIYLVLEYCEGGDLADYIRKHGKVSMPVARHFMRQLAAGLQVLQEKHLIHRDLKPQNLLLSTKEETPVLKIGDFGFVRSLTPENLADTVCGSPLYMAPEIMENQKYDAKADLWSVGAILFQLVTGKPPFGGNSQVQLFQNILASTELQFPEGTLGEIHPECVDLCRSLLRRNPVERLTFKEFFNHKFLVELRQMAEEGLGSPIPQSNSMVEQPDLSLSEKKSQLQSGHPTKSSCGNPKLPATTGYDAVSYSSSSNKAADDNFSFDQAGVADSMEAIEKEYVIVNRHCGSTETFSYYLETLVQGSSAGLSNFQAKNEQERAGDDMQKTQFAGSSAGHAKSSHVHGLSPLSISSGQMISREQQGLSILHPSTRLHVLHQYVQALAELARENYNAGLFLESFSVELIVLAIWSKALEICTSWMTSTGDSEPGPSSAIEPTGAEYNIGFSRPSSACIWAKEGFISAYVRAEEQSYHIQEMNAAAMPDAMEIIYQSALAIGIVGGEDELMENTHRAAAYYTKAKLLLSFIVGEAINLPLNPPFSLTPATKDQIQSYIKNFESRLSNFQIPVQSPRSANFPTN
ncbi:hypothetical protein SLA2020_087690 [Shorea laevis]